jgi:predicted nucleic acid-binding protein
VSGHREILGQLLVDYDLRSGLSTDATLAARCLEHGLAVVSADSDFARFTEVDWNNPLA